MTDKEKLKIATAALEFYQKHMLLGYEITDSGQVATEALDKISVPSTSVRHWTIQRWACYRNVKKVEYWHDHSWPDRGGYLSEDAACKVACCLDSGLGSDMSYSYKVV